MDERDKSFNGRSRSNLDWGRSIRSYPLTTDGAEQHRIADCVYCAARISGGSSDRRRIEKEKLIRRLEIGVVVSSILGVVAVVISIIGGVPIG